MPAKQKITLTLPDGSKREYPDSTTAKQVAESIGPRLAKAALVAKHNGNVVSLDEPLEGSGTIAICTFDSPEGKAAFWHTAAHVLAQTVLELYPEAKRAIGPPVEDGFYYDFQRDTPFTPSDLEKIEKRMHELAAKDDTLRREDVPIAEAKKFFKDNPFKLELIDKLAPSGKGTLSFYCHADYKDLCKGGHIASIGPLKAIKLTKVAGAYWHGDASKPQLQRIYGIAFPEQKLLDAHLKLLEEAEARDHRKLGKELELFFFSDLSPGSAFFYPKGVIIINELMKFMREEYRIRGYQETITPTIYDKTLWETSGHWEHYRENMFTLKVDDREFSLKPMNCPSHCTMYKTRSWSYRDLPLRLADFAALHRNEVRGALGGLTRVRKFQQDDAHIYCMPEQIESEILDVIDFAQHILTKVFDFKIEVVLSTKPENTLGDAKLWKGAEDALAAALRKKSIAYTVNSGEGAFYGPKIDFNIHDALGRPWQLSTIQLDFNQPSRFALTYEGEDGRKHQPVMIHRALLGSIERFFAILIEHYAGKFPLWLSPVHVTILPVADRHLPYAKGIREQLFHSGVRVEVDTRSEGIPKKVRDAQLAKIPYILVVGDKEEESETVNVRTRDNVVHGERKVAEFIAQLVGEIAARK